MNNILVKKRFLQSLLTKISLSYSVTKNCPYFPSKKKRTALFFKIIKVLNELSQLQLHTNHMIIALQEF